MQPNDPTTRSFSLTCRLRSFTHAGRGLRTLISSEHNAWIHATATCIVIALGFAASISRLEWALLALAIGSVWAAEALNTAFEFLCDVASPEFHPLVAKAKDVAAGAVLASSLGAATVGVLVLGPPLFFP